MRSRIVLAIILFIALQAVPEPALPAETITVAAGTPLVLVTQKRISTKTAQVGDAVPFIVGRNLRVDKLIIVAQGTPLTATVTRVEQPRRRSQGGRLELTFSAVPAVDGTAFQLTFEAQSGAREAISNGATALIYTGIGIPLGVAVALAGKGDQLTIPSGAEVLAYLPADVELGVERLRAAQPPRPVTGNASVVIYRESDLQGPGAVFCGRVKLRKLAPAQAMRVELAPGQYAFSAGYGQPIVLDLAPGDEIYLRMAVRVIALVRSHPFLVESDLNEFLRYYGVPGVSALGSADGEAQRHLARATPGDLHYVPEAWKEP